MGFGGALEIDDRCGWQLDAYHIVVASKTSDSFEASHKPLFFLCNFTSVALQVHVTVHLIIY